MAIVAGTDGNLWFTEQSADKIGCISPSTGKVVEYNALSSYSSTSSIAIGADGNIWFNEADGKIGNLSPSTDKTTEYDIPNGSDIFNITSGTDDDLWFTQFGEIGKISPTGNITEYSAPILRSSPGGITAGPDGNLWVTNSATEGNIFKISPLTGNVSGYNVR
jgi:virginiamycin B lyase